MAHTIASMDMPSRGHFASRLPYFLIRELGMNLKTAAYHTELRIN